MFRGFQTHFYCPLLVPQLKSFKVRFNESGSETITFSLLGSLTGPRVKKFENHCLDQNIVYILVQWVSIKVNKVQTVQINFDPNLKAYGWQKMKHSIKMIQYEQVF